MANEQPSTEICQTPGLPDRACIRATVRGVSPQNSVATVTSRAMTPSPIPTAGW